MVAATPLELLAGVPTSSALREPGRANDRAAGAGRADRGHLDRSGCPWLRGRAGPVIVDGEHVSDPIRGRDSPALARAHFVE